MTPQHKLSRGLRNLGERGENRSKYRYQPIPPTLWAAQAVAPTTTAFFILRDDLEEDLEELDLEELDLEKEPPLELPPLLP